MFAHVRVVSSRNIEGFLAISISCIDFGLIYLLRDGENGQVDKDEVDNLVRPRVRRTAPRQPGQYLGRGRPTVRIHEAGSGGQPLCPHHLKKRRRLTHE